MQLRKYIYCQDQLRFLSGTTRNRKYIISVTLYPFILQDCQLSRFSETILENVIVNKTYKKTCSGRFTDYDKITIQCLEQYYSRNDQLNVHDVAVSDGQVSVEFFRKLTETFTDVTFKASDSFSQLSAFKIGPLSIVTDRKASVVEIVLPPFVFMDNGRLEKLAKKIITTVFRNAITTAQNRATDILLFHPRAVELSLIEERFMLGDDNILDFDYSSQYQVVRAMNILNLGYFRPDQAQSILSRFHKALTVDGFLIVGSNNGANSLVHGGIYRKTNEGFVLILESGDGFRFHHLMSSIHPTISRV